MKKILYIAPFPLFPLDTGTKIRIYQTIRFLARRYEMHLIILAAENREDAAAQGMPCRTTRHIPTGSMRPGPFERLIAEIGSVLTFSPVVHNAVFRRHLKTVIAESAPDIVMVWGSATAQYLDREKGRRSPRWILDEGGTDHLRIKSTLAYTPRRRDRCIATLRYLRLRRYERSVCARFDHLLAVDPVEAAHLAGPMRHPSVHTVPCGANTDLFPYSYAGDDNATILFCGDLTYPPNEEAVCYCLREIMPLIVEQIDKFKFIIVGRTRGGFIADMARSFGQVTVTGHVGNMNDWWKKASIFINPVRTGRGFLTKILDAFSAGMAVVSTGTFLRQSDIIPDVHYIRGDTARDLAHGIIGLLTDPALKRRMSLCAREYALSHGWERALEPLRLLIEETEKVKQ